MVSFSAVHCSLCVIYVLENNLYACVDIRFLRQLEFMIWLRSFKQLSILLWLLGDSKLVDFADELCYVFSLGNKPAMDFSIPTFYLTPQKTSYSIEFSLSIFLCLFDNVFFQRMAELDEVETDEDVMLFLLLRIVEGLDVLHLCYKVLHLFKIYFILHEHLELFSDNLSNISRLFFFFHVNTLIIFFSFRKVVNNCSHLFSNATLSELVAQLFKFTVVLFLFLCIELLGGYQSL